MKKPNLTLRKVARHWRLVDEGVAIRLVNSELSCAELVVKAGIEIKGKDKWLTLIQNASRETAKS